MPFFSIFERLFVLWTSYAGNYFITDIMTKINCFVPFTSKKQVEKTVKSLTDQACVYIRELTGVKDEEERESVLELFGTLTERNS